MIKMNQSILSLQKGLETRNEIDTFAETKKNEIDKTI